MAQTTLEFARSQLEWMNESLVKSFGHSKDNPFTLKFLKVYGTLAELKKLAPDGPKVVLATDPSMNAGPARHLFAKLAQDPRNVIILPLEPEEESLSAGALAAAMARDGAPPGAPLPMLQVTLSRRVPLTGAELEKHQEEEQRRQEAEAAARSLGGAATATAMGEENISVDAMDMDSLDALYADEGGDAGNLQAPTRANVATIGHAGREAMGARREVAVAADALDALNVDDCAGNCLIEGFEIPEGAVGPMFPAEDEWEEITYDEYGATVEYADFESSDDMVGGRLGRALASEAAAERGGLDDGDGEGGGAAVALEIEVPTKIETKDVVVALAARVLRFEFDGVSDGRSVQTMLGHVAPRNTLLIHGTDGEKAELASKLERELEGLYASVFVPGEGEDTEIVIASSIEMALSDKLARATDVHGVSGYQLAWIDSIVGPPQDGAETNLDAGEDAQQQGTASNAPNFSKNRRLLTLLPPPVDGTVPDEDISAAYGGVFIGDVRLSELKKALTAVGVASEFHGGALYCAGQVVVRRRGEGGGLVLEGALGDSYYKVRGVIYGQYHVC